MTRSLLVSSAMLSVLFASPVLAQQSKAIVNAGAPAPECTLHVNYDRNADMPGYWKDANGKRVCVPFMPTNQLVPSG